MSRSLNKVMLIGNVGKDPELKYTPSGIPVTSFRLATSDTWRDREGKTLEHTDWHTIVAWRGLAEVIQKIVHKGSRVYVEGKIQVRTFEDRTGFKKNIVEILAESLLVLDTRKGKEEDIDLDFDSVFIDKPLDYHIDLESKYNNNGISHHEIPF